MNRQDTKNTENTGERKVVSMRRAKSMTVRTVAGIPVVIEGNISAQGMVGAVRLVGNLALG